MRKFTLATSFDKETFEPSLSVYMKTTDDKIERLSTSILSKYTLAQQYEINLVNTTLTDKELPQLTDEEIDYMLKLGKHSLDLALPEESEDLQALAGFKVKKEIIYTDKPE